MKYYFLIFINLAISSVRILPLPFVLTVDLITEYYLISIYFIWFSSLPIVIFTMVFLPLMAKSKSNIVKSYLLSLVVKQIIINILFQSVILLVLRAFSILYLDEILIIICVTITQTSFHVYLQTLHTKGDSNQAQYHQLLMNLLGGAFVYIYLFTSHQPSTLTIISLLYSPYLISTVKLILTSRSHHSKRLPSFRYEITLKDTATHIVVLTFFSEGVKNIMRSSLETRAPLILYVMQLVSWIMQPLQTILQQLFNKYVLIKHSGKHGRTTLVGQIQTNFHLITLGSGFLASVIFIAIFAFAPLLKTDFINIAFIFILFGVVMTESLRFLVGLWNFMGIAEGRIIHLFVTESIYFLFGILPLLVISNAANFLLSQILAIGLIIAFLIAKVNKQNDY